MMISIIDMISSYNTDQTDDALSNVVCTALTQVINSAIDEIAVQLKDEVKKSFQCE